MQAEQITFMAFFPRERYAREIHDKQNPLVVFEKHILLHVFITFD